jgi:hypothetical protein
LRAHDLRAHGTARSMLAVTQALAQMKIGVETEETRANGIIQMV